MIDIILYFPCPIYENVDTHINAEVSKATEMTDIYQNVTSIDRFTNFKLSQ